MPRVVQFLNHNTPESYVASSFGAAGWARLKALKRMVDPTNVLRFSLGGGTDVALPEGIIVGKESKGVIIDGYSDVDRKKNAHVDRKKNAEVKAAAQ